MIYFFPARNPRQSALFKKSLSGNLLSRMIASNHCHSVIHLLDLCCNPVRATYDQIRVVNTQGECVGVYAKRALVYDEAYLTAGNTALVHELNGLKFGMLICNDFWVTPGFSDGPDPHYSLTIARSGAQVIFHAVNSGYDQRYRHYHESNHYVRAAEAKCQVVAVNAWHDPVVNATSGVVGPEFSRLEALPRDQISIQTVEFAPVQRP